MIVEAGGDLLASGAKDDQSLWKIGVQSPRSTTNGLLTKMELRNQAAATSGDYLNTFTADLSQHHIIDPLTGHSSPELASATIVGKSALEADALATGIMVLGVSQGLALVESLPGVEAYLVTKELEIHQSSTF